MSAIKSESEIKEIRKNFKDDISVQSYDLLIKLEDEITSINHTFKELQLALDKDKGISK